MNPIKNGKQVFAVLSMATVMSISMSVKVNAASEIDAAAHTAANAVVQSENKNTSSSHTNVKTNSDASSEKREEVSAIDSKEASVGDKSTVVESANSLEISSENVGGQVGSGDQSTENVNAEGKQTSKEATAPEQNPAEATLSKLNSDENKATEDETLEVNSEAKTVEKNQASDENLDVSEGKVTEPQKAPEKVTEPNYSEEEKNIKNYNDSERYKTTDLTPGSTIVENVNTDEGVAKDGFKFNTLNPSKTSPSKTEYGYVISIDKKTGQRTYTKIYVTDSGLIPLDKGNKPMMGQGEKLTPESPDVTYKPGENAIIDGVGKQRNLNYDASEETLKHLNNKDNDFTSLGFKDNYTADNPRVKFFGGSFILGYKVNPWPNENDKLELMKISGEYNEKVFVKGQDINTGVKVDNIDANAKDRLVGQVYNPITGAIVPGASAYIGDDGNIHIKMPEGALTKDKSGKTVINEGSIFNTPDYKGIQNLDVKFFARPRTLEEFKAIAETPDENGETGTYVETGAGSADINHKGTNVKIDRQGIDRYDHYNLIGKLKINLDDTRYYDQKFVDKKGNDTEKDTSIGVQPGEPFTVKMDKPEGSGDSYKTAVEMNEAEGRGEAAGKLIMDFINRENKGKAEADQWKVKTDPNDIAGFTITAPESAKAGDFIAIPVEYTYTNGSKDTKWFHFVVQESTYIKPEYDAQVNFPVNEQTSPATVAQDTKRIKPDHYSLPDTLETDESGNKLATDDKGNKWTVKVDETTGKVTAKPVDPTAFDGGEKLTVPVIAHYVDEKKPGEDITEKAHAYFVIEEKANMTPRYNAKAGKSGDQLSSDVILNTEDKYNRRPGKYTLDSPTYTDDKGNTWNVSIDENTGKVTATVPNEEEGKSVDGAFLNVPVTAHYYEEDAEGNKVEAGTKKTEVQFVAYGTNGKVEKTVEVPFETKVEKDPTLKKGEIKVITEGKKGSKKVTYTIEDSKITDEKEEELEAPQVREIHVGEGVNDGTHKIEEKVEVGFETEIQFDDSLAPGETKEIQKGEAGEKKRDITLTIEDGQVTKTETGEFTETKAPKKRIIKVGRNTEGKVEHKEELPFKYKVEEVDTLKKGEYKIVKPGKVGTKTTTWTIKNSKVEGEPSVTEDPAEDAIIQVGKGTNEGTHEVTEKKAIDYKTVIEYDENLDAGQQEVVKEGNPGEQERTNTLVIKDGQVTETKEGEFKTTKEATDRVVKIGTKPVTKVVEKPFNTEYIFDENLEAGQTEEVTPGKNGKVTITTTYDKDQKKVVTSETEEAGQNRVVKIGGKTNGTEKIKEEIPFEVEVRKDPSLKKGEWKYAKDDEGNELKGEKGEQEKTLTIVNSKVTETSEPTVTKKAKKAVILVGEGTNDGTHEIVEKKVLPFETKIEYDENLEAGQREETGGEPGEQERTNTLVIKDGKVTETKEVEFKTTKNPVDKVIKIGIKPIVKEVEKPFETEYIYDENVEMGKEEEVTPGENGKVTMTTSYDKDQNKLVTKEETKDPVKRVVKVGIKPVVKEEEIPQNTKFKHNPELKAGEIKKIKDGTPGKVIVTTTFNKETGKTETKIERVEPQDAEYEYGSKTEGTVKVTSDIPYEVEFVPDDTMAAGETKVTQEGKLGKKETTITIENSKEKSREEKILEEPVKKIVKIGTLCKAPTPGGDNTNPGGGNDDPSSPTDSSNSSNPGGNDSSNPGGNDSGTPGTTTDKPVTPGTPGETPNKLVKQNKPAEPGKLTEEKTPEGKTPEDKKFEGEKKISDSEKSEEVNKTEKAEKSQDEKELVKEEKAQEEKFVANKVLNRQAKNDDRAPKTGDAGLVTETASAGLASGLLLLLGRRKRRKEEENKKNK